MRNPSFKRMCEKFTVVQPRGIRTYFDSYFRELSRRHRKTNTTKPSWLQLPYWKVLPAMLSACYEQEARKAHLSRVFLRDVQWAQYCLYLFIRFQDDLHDGQSKSPVSIFASDQCLFEADRVLRKHFPGESWFWRVCRKALCITTQSIVEVDELQQKSNSRPEELLRGYVRVSSILKVGSAAVCAKLNQRKAFQRISLFCDEMAKVGQVIDDLYDVDEDFRRHRFNYAGNALEKSKKRMLASGKSGGSIDRLRVLATAEKICSVMQTHFDCASDAIRPLEIPEMKKYLAHYAGRLPRVS